MTTTDDNHTTGTPMALDSGLYVNVGDCPYCAAYPTLACALHRGVPL